MAAVASQALEPALSFPLSQSQAWTDLQPIPQDDGPNPVVPIAYSPHFVDVMNYFRAILKKQEYSPRALALTKEVIKVNPANYTGWLFRRECLLALKCDLKKELAFIDEIAQVSSKNYQLWHHRRVIIQELGEASSELKATTSALLEDPKNYHVWAHRQWVLRTFNLFDKELDFVDVLLEQDIRNNSAWNQRFFVFKNTTGFTREVIKSEIEYTFKALMKTPNNLSPWNYLRGLIKQEKFDMMEDVNKGTAGIYKKDSECAECLAFLIDLALEYPTAKKLKTASKMCENLRDNLSKIRAKYWDYQRDNVEKKLEEVEKKAS